MPMIFGWFVAKFKEPLIASGSFSLIISSHIILLEVEEISLRLDLGRNGSP